jgi:hypothetical protein
MIKVKEYLDLNFKQIGIISADLKKNGQYNIQGNWQYPLDYVFNNSIEREIDGRFITQDHIEITINNETIILAKVLINGIFCSKYHYMQTYLHIPRGEADINGYYARSTDDEIIGYIDGFLKIIQNKK